MLIGYEPALVLQKHRYALAMRLAQVIAVVVAAAAAVFQSFQMLLEQELFRTSLH